MRAVVLALLVGAVAVLLAPSGGDCSRRSAAPATPSKGVAVPPSMHEPFIGVPFLLPGERLGIGYGLLGDPISAFEKLYLENKHGLTLVTGPAELVGHVRIDSPDKALRYVRLFTSPTTVKSFQLPVWLEVVPASVVDLEFLYGRKRTLEEVRRWLEIRREKREYGVVTDREWRALRLSAPSVKRVGANFVVTRGLVQITERSAWGTGIVQQVEETVSRDGRVTRNVVNKRKVPGLLVSLMPEE